jgi:hypothetical protein
MGLTVTRLRQGARALARTPGVWALAVLALSLGIGANATVFAAIRGAILRPLELLPARTVVIVSANPRQGRERALTSMRDYLAWRNHLQSLREVIAYEASGRTVSGGGEPERLQVMRVSEGYFRFFDLTPALGRFMNPEESHSGRDQVAVLSYGLWQRRFGGRSNVVGEKLQLDDAAYTIIGVASARTVLLAESVQVWLPLVTDAMSEARLSRSLGVWGLLKPGASITRAQQANAVPASAGIATDQPTSPIIPKPNQTPRSELRCALSLRAVQTQKLPLHRRMQSTEVGSASRVADRDEHIQAGLDQNAFIDGHINLGLGSELVDQNS